ncbi:MAG: glycoside hydrolase, family 15, partial [uncultured bacterium]
MRYGIIGNCKTAALVHETGSIEWCCLPKFDSPSVFAALLDSGGGFFKVEPVNVGTVRQFYLPQTNILQTEFDDGQNAFAVLDFMPRYREGQGYAKPLEIIRMLKPLRGKPLLRILFKPKLNYARSETQIELWPNMIVATQGLEDIYLYSNFFLKSIMEETSILLENDGFLILTYHEKFSEPTLVYAR